MKNSKVILLAPVSSASGYGERSRDIARAMLDLDLFGEFNIIDMPWGNLPRNVLKDDEPDHVGIIENLRSGETELDDPDICFHIGIPSEFQYLGKINIGITAGSEVTDIPKSWIKRCNDHMDMVIVSSTHSKEVFEKCGVTVPIKVLFEGLPDIFQKNMAFPSVELQETLNSIDEEFCFFSNGIWEMKQKGLGRKGLTTLVEAFTKAFAEYYVSPALVLKTNGANYSLIDREEILETIRSIQMVVGGEDSPSVYLLHGQLTKEEMSYVYSHDKIKAYVSFTRGEGFGRCLLEASFADIPIIAPNFSGHTDFLDNIRWLDGKLTDIPEQANIHSAYGKGSKWFTPNPSDTVSSMIDVYENYTHWKNVAIDLGERNRQKYSYDRMKNKLEVIINGIQS